MKNFVTGFEKKLLNDCQLTFRLTFFMSYERKFYYFDASRGVHLSI